MEYAGGAFTTVNGNKPRSGAAALDPTTGAAGFWDARLVLDSGAPGREALAPTASTLYLGGVFDRQNTGGCAPSCFFTPNLAAVSLTNGNALTTWQPVPNGAVNALAVAPQGLVVGGAYSALGYPPPGAAYAPDEPAATYRGGLALLPALPDAPVATATAGDTSATVTLQPAYVGGSAVVGYTLIYTTTSGNVTVSSPTSPITVTGLTNGTAYIFSATITTTAGTSAASLSNGVIPHTIPGPPITVTAVPSDGSAKVNFLPPLSDGGDHITEYTVTSSPDGKTASGPRRPDHGERAPQRHELHVHRHGHELGRHGTGVSTVGPGRPGRGRPPPPDATGRPAAPGRSSRAARHRPASAAAAPAVSVRPRLLLAGAVPALLLLLLLGGRVRATARRPWPSSRRRTSAAP